MKSNGLDLMLDYLESDDQMLNRQALRCIKNLAQLDETKMTLVEDSVLSRLLDLYSNKLGITKRKSADILGLLACNRK